MTARDTASQPGPDPVRRRLAVARGDEPADLVLKGGRVLSVFTGEVFEADVAICGEQIAGLGSYHAPRETDVRGMSSFLGLLSELPFEDVAAGSSRLDEAAHADLGATYPAPLWRCRSWR
jgi:adenine deaminase